MKANRVVLSAIAGVVTFGTGLAPAATWLPSTGNWSVPTNWSPANVPDATSETATINTGTATLDGNYSIGTLVMGGGTITGPNTLVSATFGWASGTMIGPGTTTVTGTATLAPSNNTTYLSVNGRTLNLQSMATQTIASNGYGVFLGGSAGGGVLNNSGTYALAADTGIIDAGYSGAAFNNFGALNKIGGSGTGYVQALTNTGTIRAQSGTLEVTLKGGTTSTGTFSVDNGSTLSLIGPRSNATHTFSSTATFTGTNIRLASGGGPIAASGTITAGVGSTVKLEGATISGVGTWQFANFGWTSGTMTGPGITTVTGTATLAPADNTTYLNLNGRTLNLQSTSTQTIASTGYGVFLGGSAGGGVLNNSGTYALAADTGVYDAGYTGAAFNNSGTLSKTAGTGTGYVQALTNTGIVNVQSGTLEVTLKGGAITTGTFNTASGSALILIGPRSNAAHTFSSTTTFTGTNIRLVSGGGPIAAGGTVASAVGSTVTLNGATINGTGTWQFSNFVWSSGTMSEAGTTTITGTATFAPSDNTTYLNLNGRTLNLQTATTQSVGSDGYGLRLGGSTGAGVLNNFGTYALVADTGVSSNGNTGNAFNNFGTLSKTAGAGTGYIQALTNSGNINSLSGTLEVSLKGGTTSSGIFNVANGSTLNVIASSGTHTFSSTASFAGTGSLQFTGGTSILQGSRTITSPVTINGGTVRIGAATDLISSLTFAGGRIDVGTGIVFNINGGGAANLAAARPLVSDGSYFTSSSDSTHRLGYKDTGTAIEVRYTLNGDADLDGGVSINDFNALAGNFGKSTGQFWTNGDFDYDGGVSINDFNLLAGQFGKSLAAPGATPDFSGLMAFAAAHDDLVAFEAVTGVPEPSSLAVVAAGATLALRRQRV